MSNKFWSWYIFFFVYIFPLFFSYVGMWGWGAWPSTISLAVGIIGWIWFVKTLYNQYVTAPTALFKEAQELRRNGKLVDAEITEILSKKETKRGYLATEFAVSFPNLAGTPISSVMDFIDSKPHLNRYEVGKKLPLRLNTKKGGEIPWLISDGELVREKSRKRWLYVFTIVYAIVVFIVNYIVFSNGTGWRWLTLYHPWVIIPYWGIFTERIVGKTLGKIGAGFSGDDSTELLLHGVEAVGKITKANQTGKFINEQPEMKFSINYTDKKGQTHYVEKKKIALLSEMHRYQLGEVKLLYLPNSPQTIELL